MGDFGERRERRDFGSRPPRGDFRGGSRDFSGPRGGGGGGFGPRPMHKATCAECGAECEVPFQPKEGRPVYCRDCYRNKQAAQE